MMHFIKKILSLVFLLSLFLFIPLNVQAQVHERPVTTSSLAPDPTSPGSGLSFYSDPVTITLQATTATGYTAISYYKIDGGTQQTYSIPFTVSGVGKHSIEYWSIDNSGIEELTHNGKGFTIGYQHALVNSIAQNGINIDVSIHIDNIQPYLNYIGASNGGTNCWNDNGMSFELYNAITGARVSSFSGQGAFHCGSMGDPSEGNQWLAFPPIQLPSGTYFIHYSGGSFDWITENYTYTAPVLHNPPTSTSSLSPAPTSPGSGLSFYSDPVIVTLNATADTGYSIANIYYKVDGGAQQTYSAPFTVSGVQKHYIEYWSVDNTGFEEPNHKSNSFTISFQHGLINSIAPNGNYMDISIHIDNIQPYLNYIGASNGGTNCWNDNGVAFEIYDATTGGRISSFSGQGAFHCGSIGPASDGNQWLAFPPLQLSSGTYFIHYSGGNFDWITENYTYTAPIPAHNNPVTTSTLSPSPTSPGTGLTFYSDPVTVTLNATADTGYNIANTYYKVDGGTQQTYTTTPITVSGIGKHQVEYWSIDNSGIEETTHRYTYFTIGYQHGLINSIAQNSISIDISIHIDNIQPYLNYIGASNGGNNCWNDNGVSFELYNATTGARVSSYSGQGAFHCGSIGTASEGNQWLGFPPLLLYPGTYFIHYSGGNFDWITENFIYAPTPTTTATLATQHDDGTYSNPTTITLSAAAAVGTTLANTYYRIDGGSQQTYASPFTVSNVGEHTVEYWSVDNSGVQEFHKTESFTIYINQTPLVAPLSGATITAGDTYTEISSFTDPDSSLWTATVDYDEGIGPETLSLNPDKTFNLSNLYETTGEYTVTVVVRDAEQNTGTTFTTVVVVEPTPTPTNTPTPTPIPNVAPVVGAITASVNPVQVGTQTGATANFTDANTSDTHTAIWDWGDGMTSPGDVTESNGSGSVAGNHVYLAAGVYEVTLTVEDNHGASDSEVFQYISVYNPTPQSLFTGVRIFNSPAGAIPTQPTVTGNVQFGITAKYQGTGINGDVSMNFNAGDIEFESTSLTVFVTANGKATLRGTGTINGTGNYTFLVTGLDGGSGGDDFIRFQIKNGSTVVYDTQPGAADTANPTTLVTAGQVIVH